MYSLVFLDAARKQLSKLDKSVALRIKRKLDWLLENTGSIEPEGLRHDLAGLAKIREGDYRIVYQLLHDEKSIVVHSIGHRSGVYKR